ncbi:hypothetical protein HUJ04_000313 [Dendroctonus ponderosae]|nr:hypothetical protein HUJ04_000313 [Dendroctonus ponderosae]
MRVSRLRPPCVPHPRRKTTVTKYERAYKKPIPKKYLNHSPEELMENARSIQMLPIAPGDTMGSLG